MIVAVVAETDRAEFASVDIAAAARLGEAVVLVVRDRNVLEALEIDADVQVEFIDPVDRWRRPWVSSMIERVAGSQRISDDENMLRRVRALDWRLRHVERAERIVRHRRDAQLRSAFPRRVAARVDRLCRRRRPSEVWLYDAWLTDVVSGECVDAGISLRIR